MTTITINRALLEQALALLSAPNHRIFSEPKICLNLRAALAAPAIAPEAWMTDENPPRTVSDYTKSNMPSAAAASFSIPLARMRPATAPAQPSWQDAPTKPGMWACLYMGELSTAIFNAYEIEHFDASEMGGCRWQFIPDEDKP